MPNDYKYKLVIQCRIPSCFISHFAIINNFWQLIEMYNAYKKNFYTLQSFNSQSFIPVKSLIIRMFDFSFNLQ